MVISDGAILPLTGIIDNTGTIELNSTGNGTDLELIEHGITLQGDGQVILSDNGENVITGTVSDVTLTNVDNTISGAGQLGDGVTLVNEGTIDRHRHQRARCRHRRKLIVNSGTLEATGSGGLLIQEMSQILDCSGRTAAMSLSRVQSQAVAVPTSMDLRRSNLVQRHRSRPLPDRMRPAPSSWTTHSTLLVSCPALGKTTILT